MSSDNRDSGLIFLPNFIVGSTTAAYQIESADRDGGRTESIWDTFSYTLGKTWNGDTGDVTDDHYFRLESDLQNFGHIPQIEVENNSYTNLPAITVMERV